MAKAFFAGSFNPFTIGHLDIVSRGLQIFDEIILGIGTNISKEKSEETDKNTEHLKSLFEKLPSITVISYDGLTTQAAKNSGADVLLRSFRNSADAEYERNLAESNSLISGMDTVLLCANPEFSCISSSMVRELQKYNYDTSKFLPTAEQCMQACSKYLKK